MNSLHLLRLLQITDPTLPIGGFSHSSGLETYVQQGIVHNRETAHAFISAQLGLNLRYTDAALASLAYDAATANAFEKLMELDHTCNALKLPREMREASQKLGIRLIKILDPLFDNDLGKSYWKKVVEKDCWGHYCIVFGLYCAVMGIDKSEALTGFFYNAAAGFVTNCVKLVPLGQQEGQSILFSLQSLIIQLAEESLNPDPTTIGMCCTAFDIRSMQHERLYSRLYMS